MQRDTTPTARTTVAGRPDRILVRRHVVETYVGINDAERREPQRLCFDVEVDTVDGYADVVRSSGDFVSYADIVEFVDRYAADGGHVDLVETWAEIVADFVLANELAAAVRVTITKPDIFANADAVGVSIERRRGGSVAPT